jgi:hypothetical protein
MLFFCFSRQQYEFDDSNTPLSTAAILHRHEIASTSICETRKTASTRKVCFLIELFLFDLNKFF